jgi:hypothetical protein
MVAVLGGATSLAAIARFAADTDSDLCEQLGLTSRTSNASTLGRFLALAHHLVQLDHHRIHARYSARPPRPKR